MYYLAQGGGSSLTGKSSLTDSQPFRLWKALSALSSRTCFGIYQTKPVECNAGQMLKRVQHDQKGFTMAEILLSLTIIGVVAAITLPSLTGNINERTWNTQRKALYARMSQAVALMPALNGYGTLKEASSAGASDAVDTAAETFITDGLAKVLKINNICDSAHIEDCGLPETFTNLAGSGNIAMPKAMSELNSLMLSASYVMPDRSQSYSMLDTKAAAFETQNGESILLFYNPNCVSNMGETNYFFAQPKVCVNMVYDLNGNKGPNTVGKDIGVMSVLYPTDSVVVAPVPFNKIFAGTSAENASTFCTEKTGTEARIPTKEEIMSLFVNQHKMFGLEDTSGHWITSTKVVGWNGVNARWIFVSSLGEFRFNSGGESNWSSFCVRR